jgi:D-alanyl-D-alanine carboxypeptidase/D-alanyl-D-alanine-endopeptidase (penicillin-binding protein 4)
MRSQSKKLLIVAAFGICLAPAVLLGKSEAAGVRADLAGQIDAIVSRTKNAEFSIQIMEAGSGKAVYQHNAKKALTPASNMKVIVSTAALKYLGANYEYKTKVGLRGDTLIVIGSGDPLLGDKSNDARCGRQTGWIFEDIAAALKRSGIAAINDIVIDTGVFDDQRVHPNWSATELNRWYACEVSGLNFNDNCIEVYAENNNGQVTVLVEPQTRYVQVISEVTAASTGGQAVGSYRTAQANRIVVFGTCKDRVGPFFVAIERPATFFGFLLAESLAKAGINVGGQIVEKAVADTRNVMPVTEYRTPIADCLSRCNKESLGLAAESLLKTIAANSNPDQRAGSWNTGREIITRYLTDLGIGADEFYVDDGSGLSRENKLSANTITKVLFDVYKSENWQLYKSSLAVGGVDGTIAKHFEEQKYKGKILGKTGYISGVRSFSGVCSIDSGDYIFSILANNADGLTRDLINDIAKAIIDSL